METYEQYKDSGVEWIGEIPVGWDVRTVKHTGEVVTGNTPSKLEEELYYTDDPQGFLWVKPTSLTGSYYVVDSEEKLTELGRGETRTIPGNSIMICCIGNTIGKYGISGKELSTNQQINSIIPSVDHLLPWYCLFSIAVFTRDLLKWTNFVTLPIFTKSDLENVSICVPPLPEQQQIVTYLDQKTSQIDDLIDKKTRKIELLKEYRRSLINQVVTRGLDPNVVVKDSGVEWIGEIPEGWDIVRLKYVVNFDSGFSFKSDDYCDNGIPLIRIGSLYQNKLSFDRSPVYLPETFLHVYRQFVVESGDILISLTGTLGKRDYGYSILYTELFPSLLNQRVGRVRQKTEKISWEFTGYQLLDDSFLNQLFSKPTGTKQGNLSSEDVLDNYVFIPPLPEQQQIVTYLDKKTQEIDQSIQTEEKKIEHLKEYRQSLISNVVTGKIDVRDTVLS
jgi:type I restriction enzyme, S subunit